MGQNSKFLVEEYKKKRSMTDINNSFNKVVGIDNRLNSMRIEFNEWYTRTGLSILSDFNSELCYGHNSVVILLSIWENNSWIKLKNSLNKDLLLCNHYTYTPNIITIDVGDFTINIVKKWRYYHKK